MIKKIQRPTFAVCVNNKGYNASLEKGKLYEVVADKAAQRHGMIRVVDESGEDYGYSAERFFVLPVPPSLERLLKASLGASRIRPRAKPAKRIPPKTAVKKQ